MTLESIYYIGQTIAVVALLVSLIFVGNQIRILRGQIRGAGTVAHYENIMSLVQRMLDDDELYKIAIRGNEDLDDLNDWEKYRYAMFALQEAASWELLYHLYRQGAIDKTLHDGREAFWLESWSSPGRRKWWNDNRFALDPSFVEYADAKLKDVPIRAASDAFSAYPKVNNLDDYKTGTAQPEAEPPEQVPAEKEEPDA